MRRAAMYDSDARPLWLPCRRCGEPTPHDVDVLVHDGQAVGVEISCAGCDSAVRFSEVADARR